MDETDALGHIQRLGVPSRTVEHEDDHSVASCPGFACKERECFLEQLLIDGFGDVPEALACGRRDEGGHVEPFEPVMHTCHRARPARCPDTTQNGL